MAEEHASFFLHDLQGDTVVCFPPWDLKTEQAQVDINIYTFLFWDWGPVLLFLLARAPNQLANRSKCLQGSNPAVKEYFPKSRCSGKARLLQRPPCNSCILKPPG